MSRFYTETIGKTKNDFTQLFYAVFKNSEVGMLIVDEETQIADVNDYMLKRFRLKKEDVLHNRFGNVFACTAVHGSDIVCGYAKECENCDIRNGLMQVLKYNNVFQDVSLKHTFYFEGANEVKWFMVSGSPVTIGDHQYAIMSFSDITRLKQYEEILNNKLMLDLATGTLNKYSLIASLQELTMSVVEGRGFTVTMIDFDDFKNINDTYGHSVGDKVIEKFSEIAHRNIRKNDIIGRYGGEEFMFVFLDSDEIETFTIIKRIHAELRQHFKYQIKQPVTFSAGIVSVTPDDIQLLRRKDIVVNVDRMLYQAKKHGKNRAVLSNGEMVFD